MTTTIQEDSHLFRFYLRIYNVDLDYNNLQLLDLSLAKTVAK